MKMNLELCDVPGTLGVPEREWVLTLDNKVIAKCDERDDTDNPSFWYAPEEMGSSSDTRLSFEFRVHITDAIRFMTRLSWSR